jgi:uncharacterized protein YjbJ (UPF0337 family)
MAPAPPRTVHALSKGRLEVNMNWDRIEGNWKQLRGRVREQWGELTDDDLDRIGGKREQLIGRIQEQYGLSKDEADRRVRDWETRDPS